MKKIKVTPKNILAFRPYQGTTREVQIGEELTVISEKIPCVHANNCYFVIVTDYQPNNNSLRMISRASDPEASKYGWITGAETVKNSIAEKDVYVFNRYSINQKSIK